MHNTLGVILAGGQSQRMGVADKFLLHYRGQSLLQHAINGARPQVTGLVISANGDPRRLATYPLAVIADQWTDHFGPLAGIISVMSWAQKARKHYSWLATFAADTPHFPEHCVADLHQRAQQENLEIVFARNGDQNHYTFALWSMRLGPSLTEKFMAGERGLRLVMTAYRSGSVNFEGDKRWFFNFNTPADWTR